MAYVFTYADMRIIIINILLIARSHIHRRTGRWGWLQILPTQIFWAARESWAKPFFFFEEVDIFYFNLKSAW